MSNSDYSIVLCSYNGEDYISEQLQSLLRQTLPASEVLIFDDQSTDDTVSIIQRFIADNGCGNWKVAVNEYNKGWRRNFIDGIAKAKYPYIFLCDQDDIWDENKCRMMVAVLERNEGIELLSCGYIRNDKRWKDKSVSGDTPAHVYPVATCEWGRVRPGCTIAMRRTLVDYIRMVWDDQMAHDAVAWLTAAARGTAFTMNDRLVYWREHAQNSTPSNKKNRTARLSVINRELHYLESLESHADVIGIPDANRDYLNKKIAFANKRYLAVHDNRIELWLFLIRKLHLYTRKRLLLSDYLSAHVHE